MSRQVRDLADKIERASGRAARLMAGSFVDQVNDGNRLMLLRYLIETSTPMQLAEMLRAAAEFSDATQGLQSHVGSEQ